MGWSRISTFYLYRGDLPTYSDISITNSSFFFSKPKYFPASLSQNLVFPHAMSLPFLPRLTTRLTSHMAAQIALPVPALTCPSLIFNCRRTDPSCGCWKRNRRNRRKDSGESYRLILSSIHGFEISASMTHQLRRASCEIRFKSDINQWAII